ncbi:Uncharacterised protein [Escherichia coli]|nr:Uncharacterised protein [Escherichia coli]
MLTGRYFCIKNGRAENRPTIQSVGFYGVRLRGATLDERCQSGGQLLSQLLYQ